MNDGTLSVSANGAIPEGPDGPEGMSNGGECTNDPMQLALLGNENLCNNVYHCLTQPVTLLSGSPLVFCVLHLPQCCTPVRMHGLLCMFHAM